MSASAGRGAAGQRRAEWKVWPQSAESVRANRGTRSSESLTISRLRCVHRSAISSGFILCRREVEGAGGSLFDPIQH